jgi:hypothetical protein
MADIATEAHTPEGHQKEATSLVEAAVSVPTWGAVLQFLPVVSKPGWEDDRKLASAQLYSIRRH